MRSAIIASTMMRSGRRHRAGESVEDYCRACKTDRMHTVIAADEEGRPIRVDCGFCHSEHNYRGGPRVPSTGPAAAPQRTNVRSESYGGGVGARAVREPARGDREGFASVSAGERARPTMAAGR